MKSARSFGFVLALACAIGACAVSQSIAQQDEAAAVDDRAIELYRAGKYAEAIPLAQRALAIREKALGPDHPGVATSLKNLAFLYKSQGRYASAEPLYKRALAIREKALGPSHPDVSISLSDLAALYYSQGRYADAEPLFKRALAIDEKALGPDHRFTATSLNNLALLYDTQGRYADAEPLYKRAMAIREKTLGSDHPDVANSLNDLASLYDSQGRYADAEPLYERALAIREKALGPDHRDVATSLNNLAKLYGAQSRYADAEPLYKRALAIYEKALGPDHPSVATPLNNLALLYDSQGRYADAEPLYKRALAIREEALGPDHPSVANSLNNLAELYGAQSRYADAELLYKRAMAIYEKALGPDHPNLATSLNNLAELYRTQGRYADAEPLYKRALAIYEKALGPDHADAANSLNNLAMLYDSQGRYADAEPLFKRALAIREKALGRDHPNVAGSLNNLAELYRAQSRYADAEPLYKRALSIDEKALGPGHPGVATSLNNLAELYRAQSRYADAEPLYKRTLAILEKALGPDHPNVASTLNNLASLYTDESRYVDAEPFYKRALATYEKALGPDHPSVANSLNGLAWLYYAQGRHAESLPLVQKTVASGRPSANIALPILFQGSQDAGLMSATNAINAALNIVQRASGTSAALAVNKLAVRLAAGSDRLAQLVRNEQDLAAEEDSLDKAILAAVSKGPAQRDATVEQRIRDRLAAIAQEREALQKVFATEFPSYAALSNPEPLAIKDIQGLLAADEVLVAYFAGNEQSQVFALTREAATWNSIPLGAAALGEKVAAFRHGLDLSALQKSMETGKPQLFDLALAYELYSTLLGPVEARVKGKRHLLVVPSGPLTSLPFHLLVTEKPAAAVPQLKDIATYRNAAWLLKQQAVSILPAIASLKGLRVRARNGPARKPMVGFGDPIFDPAERAMELAARTKPARQAAATRGLRNRMARPTITRAYNEVWQGSAIDRAKLGQALPSLLDTADELKAVAAKLGAPISDVHLSADATETTVKRTPLADYRVVYFATHGLVAGDVKGLGEPSLALTLPHQPSDLDDGLLTASEVAQLKLNADWVVLSACNTAAGDKPGAEALSGLARAFFYAGARALLVSHWSVASEAATRLTTATFDIMKADPKAGRAEALRRAMLDYMNDETQPLNAYPGFWGPFSIVGEGAAR